MGPTPHQKEVIDSINGIFVVDAGPGTGKTYTITNRYLSILDKGKVTPRDILLLTFTKNAAENMKEKIVNALLQKDPACNVLDTRISTFHSFCNSALSMDPTMIPSYLGIDKSLTRNFTIVQDGIIERRIFLEAYSKIIGENEEKYKDMHAIVGNDISSLHSIVKKLLSKGILPTNEGWMLDGYDELHGNKECYLDAATRLNESIPGIRGPKQSELRNAVNASMRNKPLLDAPNDLFEGKILNPELIECAFEDDREILFSFIHDIALEFISTCISSGQLTFDLLVAFCFLQFLHDDEARCKYSFDYVMIDEFQDTNELQLMLVALLMKKPNLCVVGDWKQGIYGFRNASIDNILQFENKFSEIVSKLNKEKIRIPFDTDATKKEFIDNFRSSQEIINFSCKSLLVPAKKDEVMDIDTISDAITPLKSINDYGINTSIRFCCAQSKENEVDVVIRTIQQIVASGDFMINKSSDARTPTYGDIAVLTRTRGFGLELQNAARRRGIPINFDAGVELFSSDEGSLLLSWLRVIANYNDRRGWAGILEAEGISPMQKRTMIRTLDIPENLIIQRSDLISSSRSIVLMISKIFGYYSMDTSFTRSIVDTVSSVFSNYPLSLEGMIAYIEDSIAKKDTYEMDINTAHDAVSIQTIHGSKGLEYPIVIVANCNEKLFPSLNSDKSIVTYDELIGLRCAKVAGRVGEYYDIFDNWKTYLVRRVVQKNYDEERRLMFVALSRAKQHIIVTAWKPSVFFNELSIGKEKYNPSVQTCLTPCYDTGEQIEIPELPPYASTSKNISLHDIMGEIVYGGGEGIQFGSQVHKAAQDIALGFGTDMLCKETKNISSLIESLGTKNIMPEVRCTYPISDYTVRGVIDLLALYSDKFIVIDYKTDTDIDVNLEKYKIQLSVYYHAIKEYYGIDGEVKIAYISIGEVKDIEPLPKHMLESIVDDYIARHHNE